MHFGSILKIEPYKKFCLKMAICIAKKVLTFNIHKAKGNIGVNESSMKSKSHKRDKISLESNLNSQNPK